MNFDFKEFRKQKFQARTGTVELKQFGDSQELIEWQCKGLTAIELEQVDAAVEKNNAFEMFIETAIKAIGGDEKAKKQSIYDMLGVSDNVPDSLVRKYLIFELGSIEPNKPNDRSDVIKFATVYPIEFRRIVSKILELTGLGQIAKKKPLEIIGNSETT